MREFRYVMNGKPALQERATNNKWLFASPRRIVEIPVVDQRTVTNEPAANQEKVNAEDNRSE